MEKSFSDKVFEVAVGIVFLLFACVMGLISLLIFAHLYVEISQYLYWYQGLTFMRWFEIAFLCGAIAVCGLCLFYAFGLLIGYIRSLKSNRKEACMGVAAILGMILVAAVVFENYQEKNRAETRKIQNERMASNFRASFHLNPPANDSERRRMREEVYREIDYHLRFRGMGFHGFQKEHGVLKGGIPEYSSIMQGIRSSLRQMCDSSLHFGFQHPYCMKMEQEKQAEASERWLFLFSERLIQKYEDLFLTVMRWIRHL